MCEKGRNCYSRGRGPCVDSESKNFSYVGQKFFDAPRIIIPTLYLLLVFLILPCQAYSAERKKPFEELKKVTKPAQDAVKKTAKTAVKEARAAVKGAHTYGGKLLQGIINVMIAASPGKTRVYLPAPSNDPNSGATVGFLPVFLFVDDREEIRHILAPMITYNRIFGINSTISYYWYPREHSKVFVLGSYATETNRRFTFRYEDSAFLSEWFYLKLEATALRNGAYRFFGLGPKSNFHDQANYTLRDTRFHINTGINFLEGFRFIISHRVPAPLVRVQSTNGHYGL